MTIDIRIEAPADRDAIDAVITAAFLDAPHSTHAEHLIVRALRNTGTLALSLVADDGGVVVGHVAASPVSLADGTPRWFGLGPVAVAPSRQRQGIGARLVARALSELRTIGAGGCVVLGEPGYYGRFGFTRHHALELPGMPPEYFLAIVLSGAAPRGVVRYDEAFGAGA